MRRQEAAIRAPTRKPVTVEDNRKFPIGHRRVTRRRVTVRGWNVRRQQRPDRWVGELASVVGFGAGAAGDRGVPDLHLDATWQCGCPDAHRVWPRCGVRLSRSCYCGGIDRGRCYGWGLRRGCRPGRRRVRTATRCDDEPQDRGGRDGDVMKAHPTMLSESERNGSVVAIDLANSP